MNIPTTRLAKSGKNKLKIEVTIQYTNRLIGDRLAAPGEKALNSNLSVFGVTLKESGLLGPVRILCNK